MSEKIDHDLVIANLQLTPPTHRILLEQSSEWRDEGKLGIETHMCAFFCIMYVLHKSLMN